MMNKAKVLAAVPALYARGRRANRYAAAHDLAGIDFADYGRHVGRRLLLRSDGLGVRYLLAPVESVRYLEFEFVRSQLPARSDLCLDLSSPRLFSLYAVARHLAGEVMMVNPDAADLAETSRVVAALSLANVRTKLADVLTLRSQPATYDCIWSISVIEHISGTCDDSEAVGILYNALRPGGRLIITVPTSRSHQDEWRSSDAYGTQAQQTDGRYFFQRHYTEETVRRRLIAAAPGDVVAMAFYGERIQGHFRAYEERWITGGWPVTVSDAREVVDNWRRYPSWACLPGDGICGFAIDKP